MAEWRDDYTRSRAVGVVPYEADAKIGREDGGVDKSVVTDIVASGTVTLLPESPLGRRDYISVVNTGAVDVEIFESTVSGAAGVTVAGSGGVWEMNASGSFYIKSTGANSTVTVLEKSSR